jgi:hypothetical protein
MKHLLNNLSEEEKNAIREQHTGGMKVVTENFKKLIETKSGDVKPLVNEQKTWTDNLDLDLNIPGKKLDPSKVNPKPGSTGTSPKPTAKTTSPTPKPTTYTNKTVNLYLDEKNTQFSEMVTIKSEPQIQSNGNVVMSIDKLRIMTFNCQSTRLVVSYATHILYNTKLTNSLKNNFCSKSSSGTVVPKSDFASVDTTSDENFA